MPPAPRLVVSTTDVDHNGEHIERLVPASDIEIDRLRTALQFYADAWCFTTNPKRPGLEWKPKEVLLDDCGNVARAALAASEGSTDE